MDSTLSWFKKAIVPLVGVSLALAFLPQVRAWKGREAAASRSAAPATAAALPVSSDASRVTAEGRLVTYPGAQVVVATDLAGTLTRLHVAEKDRVRKGAVLAELKADDLRAELAEQRAKV